MNASFGKSEGIPQLKPKTKSNFKKNIGRNMFIFIGLLPALLWMFLFRAYPMFMAFLKSFYNWDLSANTDSFIGLKNYLRMFHDSVFLISFVNTLKTVVYVVPATIVISLVVAVFLDSLSDRLRQIFTPAIFLPVITSMVASGAIWRWLYHPSYGLINYFLEKVGLPAQPFLTSSSQALPSVSVVAIWAEVGFYAVILLAALKGISNTFYEAAKIDGANGFKLFRYITVPLMKPTILFACIMSIMATFKIFVPIQIMTNGGPGNSSSVLAMYIYSSGVLYQKMGYASSMAIVLFAIIMFVTILQWKFIRSDWEY